jgi:hypothetical protein
MSRKHYAGRADHENRGTGMSLYEVGNMPLQAAETWGVSFREQGIKAGGGSSSEVEVGMGRMGDVDPCAACSFPA